ncbi:hypothetical protein [Spirilliplanes yamanashiensis]|uniref:histidine kinase n=1 Tax=Spirilliplanes yamanashiensis TaxID=42233 RepID=A0A8J4DHF4_9ACTN|nr:hypothetical protein [Spirilliplanes yamanashiensis]MDP9819365.1 signal transduction histidine kinase [Spirilliplanes yamanashiensis]GIJ01811.1 hypothetical protein Sya03_11630 [Spirilliplanes yamanashiensis]
MTRHRLPRRSLRASLTTAVAGLLVVAALLPVAGATAAAAWAYPPARDLPPDTLRRIALGAAVAAVLAVVLLTLLARLLVGRVLRPIDEIAAGAAVAAGQGAGLVDARTELSRLAAAVDDLTARAAAALGARDVAEHRLHVLAAQELREPLAAIRGYLQLVRVGVVDLRERPDLMDRLEQETNRLASALAGLDPHPHPDVLASIRETRAG